MREQSARDNRARAVNVKLRGVTNPCVRNNLLRIDICIYNGKQPTTFQLELKELEIENGRQLVNAILPSWGFHLHHFVR